MKTKKRYNKKRKTIRRKIIRGGDPNHLFLLGFFDRNEGFTRYKTELEGLEQRKTQGIKSLVPFETRLIGLKGKLKIDPENIEKRGFFTRLFGPGPKSTQTAESVIEDGLNLVINENLERMKNIVTEYESMRERVSTLINPKPKSKQTTAPTKMKYETKERVVDLSNKFLLKLSIFYSDLEKIDNDFFLNRKKNIVTEYCQLFIDVITDIMLKIMAVAVKNDFMSGRDDTVKSPAGIYSIIDVAKNKENEKLKYVYNNNYI